MGPFATFVLVTVYFKEILLAVVFILIVALLLRYLEHRQSSKAVSMVNEAAVAMEADHENMMYAQGDPVGVYGKYDAYTIPMTRDILDNHDDGMDQWA